MADKALTGRVQAMYIAPERRIALMAVPKVRALAGRGLEGDRYERHTGSFSRWPGEGRAVSLIAREAIDAVKRESGIDLSNGVHRRNIVTVGIDLDELVGQTFRIGRAMFKGVRPCTPCKYLERLVAEGTLAALKGRGGLRADVVESGAIAVGDEIALTAWPSRSGRGGNSRLE